MTANLTQNERKRGGQKSNQNARKHGFYSNNLSPCEMSQSLEIINQEGIDYNIAVLRIKLQSFLQNHPIHRRVFKEFSRLLVKCYRTKYQLDRTDRYYLKMVIESILEHYFGTLFCQPELPINLNG